MSRKTRRLLTATLAAGLVLSMGGAALAAPATRALKQFRVPTANSLPRAITNDANGNRWFTESDLNVNFAKIARITPAGAITEFTPGPADGCSSCGISDIAQGPGNILYITSNSSNLMRFNVLTQTFESPVAVAETGSFNDVAVGSGNVWITDFNTPAVWRYNIASGAIDQFAADTPIDVAVDAAGNAWFTENHTNDNGTSNIGRIGANASPTDPNAVTLFEIPSPANSIAVATDQQVWFTVRFTPQGVGRLNPATGVVTTFATPSNPGPSGIAASPDGTVWFTQETKGNVANITNAGVITEGKVVKGSGPAGVTVASNGDPWYTMRDANKIAALVSK